MLFSTYTFLLFFLPVTLLGFHLLGRIHWRWGTTWLIGASLAFYSWWKPDPDHPWTPAFLILILLSCSLNFLCGNTIARTKDPRMRRVLVTLGVTTNLLVLVYFKYLGLLSIASRGLTGWPASIPHPILPLAVSFFTFLQIAFLVDVFRGDKTGYNFADYLLFVTFFPHLIAGPLVHHRELISQFKPRMVKLNPRFVAIGFSVLVIGLFKKVFIANSLSEIATPFFHFAAAGTRPLTLGEAWAGALAYTLQIYFDFSGYSDMAIGLSYLFGLRLPLNFHSPYKAGSIIEFWRRWHMTLSRFLRDYCYIPLGGNRRGTGRRYANLMATMLLGGLWHGSGITFALWGVLHGLYLCVNHGWLTLRKKFGWQPLPRFLAIAITFLAVVFAWIPFRAGNYELAASGNAALAWKTTAHFYHSMVVPQHGPLWTPYSTQSLMKFQRAVRPIIIGLLIAFLLPNTQQFMGRFSPHYRENTVRPRRIRAGGAGGRSRWWRWRPIPLVAVCIFILFLIVTIEMDRGGEFIYFQF